MTDVSSITNNKGVAPTADRHLVGSSASIATLRSYRVVWRLTLVVALLQACYVAGFIARTSFVVEGQRYFCLFDDAMIAMRYAANWAAGHGFVWNIGEHVEGYTNFLWTAIMGFCHLFGLSPSHSCLLVQVLGIPILWGVLVGTVLLARSCRLLPPLACCAVVLVGTFYNLMFFTLFGMETGLLTCLVTLALADSVKSMHKKQSYIRPMLWFAPAALVRLDVLPVMLFVFIFLYFSVKRGRSRLIGGLLVVAAVVSIHFLWRNHFYGDWLPNTYYLRVTGWPLSERIIAGIRQTFFWTAITLGLPALFAITAVMLRPKRQHFLLLGSFAIAVAYQIYVGGDAWPLNRFVIPYSPGLFVLAAEGIHRTMVLFMKRKTDALGAIVRAGSTFICIVAINGVHWDHFLLLARPQTTGENRLNIRCVHAVEKIAEPDATVAVVCAGAFPYFSGRTCIDLLGKCDPHIAHLPAHPQIQRPGHNKSDLTYSLSTYKPDIVVHMVDTTNYLLSQQYQPVVTEVDGVKMVFCARRDSPKIKERKTTSWRALVDYVKRASRESNRNF